MSTMGELASLARRTLTERAEVAPGTPLVAAVSGGADSVAMAAVLATLGPELPLVAVTFIDHGIRDVSAERESARSAAERAQVRFLTARVELGGGNRQAEAREARYRALAALARPLQALVATAHTRTDQAETVLERLVRGTGLAGLQAIRPRQGQVVRPLLEVGRAELRRLGVPYAEDPTNRSSAYLRNRLRLSVWPLLLAENPRLEVALAAVADAAQDEVALADALAAELDLASFDHRTSDPRLVETLVRWRLRRDAPETPPPSRPAVATLARDLAAGARKRSVSLGGGLRGVACQGRLTLQPDRDPRFELVAWGPGSYRHFDVCLLLDELAPGEGLPHAPGDDEAWLDADAVRWPLTCRPAPYSGAGSLGVGRRGWLVVDARGEVLWGPAAGRSAPAREPRAGGRIIRMRVENAPRP
jgi:tRNA(Ile)-lysidine synthetase-like protein